MNTENNTIKLGGLIINKSHIIAYKYDFEKRKLIITTTMGTLEEEIKFEDVLYNELFCDKVYDAKEKYHLIHLTSTIMQKIDFEGQEDASEMTKFFEKREHDIDREDRAVEKWENEGCQCCECSAALMRRRLEWQIESMASRHDIKR